MKELTCIVCPVGCGLAVVHDDNVDAGALTVTGNRCPRGADYAREEIIDPRRVVTATCAIEKNTAGTSTLKRVPVRTTVPCPREKIPALLADIYGIKINLPVKTGDTVIEDWNGCGINVVVTRTVG